MKTICSTTAARVLRPCRDLEYPTLCKNLQRGPPSVYDGVFKSIWVEDLGRVYTGSVSKSTELTHKVPIDGTFPRTRHNWANGIAMATPIAHRGVAAAELDGPRARKTRKKRVMVAIRDNERTHAFWPALLASSWDSHCSSTGCPFARCRGAASARAV